MADATPERWLPIPGHEGYYEVSDLGRVRSLDRVILRSDGKPKTCRGQMLKPIPTADGYARVRLKLKWHFVHRLVLEAFVGPCPHGLCCCHRDGVRHNNQLNNLRWDSVSENQLDRVRHGTHQEAAKTQCPRGHSLTVPNLDASNLRKGKRICLACRRTHGLRLRRLARGQHCPPFQELSDAYYREILTGGRISKRVAQRLEA